MSGDERYRETAAGAVASLLNIETSASPILCCGEAGQAVALDRCGRMLRSAAERRASRALLSAAASRAPDTDARSLLQGHAGIAWLSMLAAAGQPLFVPLFFDGES
jgi:hypothetical protein